MSMPQATGMLTPHNPIPTKTRLVIVSSISWKRVNEIAKPMNQLNGVLRVRTIEPILSVTEANVSPGSITGAVECIGLSVYGFCGSSDTYLISGFGLLNCDKYVVRGFVFSSPNKE